MKLSLKIEELERLLREAYTHGIQVGDTFKGESVRKTIVDFQVNRFIQSEKVNYLLRKAEGK